MRSFILLITLVASLWAVNTGNLTFYLMKDGTPLPKQDVVIFKKSTVVEPGVPATYTKHAEFITDEDGYLATDLPVGTYQLQVLAKDQENVQAYVKKPFVIKKNKESQVIVSLKKDDSIAFSDSEAPKVLEVSNDTNVTHKEEGTVRIKLTSSEDKSLIKGAQLFVQGQRSDFKTNNSGMVEFSLPAGEYTLSMIHSHYSAQTVKLKVVPKETVEMSYEMSPSSMELEEFVVLAPQVEGSIASAINERRHSTKIEDILGSDQMSKSGDSNAQSALKRLSGVTLVDGSIYVRGLGERYTTATLNGLGLPSPEPTKRVVPLDLFPASIIDSISVQKTYSADMPAQFGGGAIDIRTKNIPDDFFAKAKIETTYNDNSTGETGAGYDGGDYDWTGFDDGTRDLNSHVKNATDIDGTPSIENREYSAIMALNKLGTHEKDIPLDGKMTLSLGDKTQGPGYELGYTASYTYENKWDLLTRSRAQYNASNGDLSTKRAESLSETTKNTINHSAMFGFGLDIAEGHSFKSTTFYTKNTTDITQLSDSRNENDDLYKKSYLSWVERDLLLTQLEGEHTSAKTDYGKFTLDWSGDIARAERYEPATREYSYKFNEATQQYLLDTRNANREINYDYVYNKLTDDVYNIKTSLKHDLEYSNGMKSKLDLGYYRYEKERDSTTKRYSYSGDQAFLSDPAIMSQHIDDIISQQNIGNYLLSLNQRSDPSSPDDYTAKHTIDAVYVSTDFHLSEEFFINAGLRREESTQSTETNIAGAVEQNSLISNENFPAINATYKFTKGMQLRAGYGKSISRPDFREFIPSSYYDDSLDMKVQGNPNLTYALIDSYDIRWEWYFSPVEMISIGAFYKEITDPIETTLIASAEGEVFTYTNAQSAELSGIEFDFRKNFDFIDTSLENFFLGGNVAFIDSEVKLSPEDLDGQGGVLTTNNREMQGQSPYVVNVQVGYDNAENGRSATLLYNRTGERIRALGISGQPDIYEQPFDQLDFVWIEEFSNGLSMKFRVKNILNDEVLWTQDDLPVNEYKVGRDYTFALSWKY